MSCSVPDNRWRRAIRSAGGGARFFPRLFPCAPAEAGSGAGRVDSFALGAGGVAGLNTYKHASYKHKVITVQHLAHGKIPLHEQRNVDTTVVFFSGAVVCGFFLR
jgi:hypothetical protein